MYMASLCLEVIPTDKYQGGGEWEPVRIGWMFENITFLCSLPEAVPVPVSLSFTVKYVVFILINISRCTLSRMSCVVIQKIS